MRCLILCQISSIYLFCNLYMPQIRTKRTYVEFAHPYYLIVWVGVSTYVCVTYVGSGSTKRRTKTCRSVLASIWKYLSWYFHAPNYFNTAISYLKIISILWIQSSLYIYIYISPFEIWGLLMFCISIWEIKHVLLPLTCVNICKDQRELPFCVCLLPKFLFIIQMSLIVGEKKQEWLIIRKFTQLT